MSILIPQNYYKETIIRAVTITGATNIYVSALPSPAEGYIAISPANSSLREIVRYTAKGTDGNGSYITVPLAYRGLGGTTAQTHAINEPVRMNIEAEIIKDISDAIDQIVAAGAQDAGTAVKGLAKLSVTPASATNPIAVGDNDPRVPTANPTTLFAPIKFGGTGADGALAISSGTTTIDLAGVAIKILNYTSVSITGTAKLAFINPNAAGTIIIIKSQGDVTLTSNQTPMIDVRNCGTAGGAAKAFTSTNNGDGHSGNDGTDSIYTIIKNNKGYWTQATNGTSTGGAIGTLNTTITLANLFTSIFKQRFPWHWIGAGGASGGDATNIAGGTSGTSGKGGNGGTTLIIECGGAWNFTTANGLSCAGENGGNATGTAGTSASIGGGGGGGGGLLIALYNTLTANTGTVATTSAGGTGVQSGNCGGSGGGSPVAAANNANSSTGSAGGAGLSLIALNTDFN